MTIAPNMSDEKELMTQCALHKGGVRLVTWLPAKFAVLGSVLKLKRASGEWEDGWEVTGVYASEHRSVVSKMQVAHRKHRKHSDI